MNEYYNNIIWQKANGKFTSYLRRMANGVCMLHGHVNGTPREADQLIFIPRACLDWAERAAAQYLATGALPRLGQMSNVI